MCHLNISQGRWTEFSHKKWFLHPLGVYFIKDEKDNKEREVRDVMNDVMKKEEKDIQICKIWDVKKK